jgi:coenzyme F420-dependent glucose-6-phosphate dehydrogenase
MALATREIMSSPRRVGFHASHEQLRPSVLLERVARAERAGFAGAMCSDHFHPWSERQGQSGFAWSWLGAALARTRLPLGVVVAPGQRYHPAVIAQAAATLLDMFPGRFWMAVGSGEAVNEVITGEPWPSKPRRNERLRESVEVMRALWSGETVGRIGQFDLGGAQLYTRPPEGPKVFGAALTEATAEWMGGWADGLITTARAPAELEGLVKAFARGGGRGKPMILQVVISYAPTQEEAEAAARDQWAQAALPSAKLAELASVREFDEATRTVAFEKLSQAVRISSDLDRHASWLRQDFDLGFSEVYLHNVARDQDGFIETFAREVLPQVSYDLMEQAVG